MNTANNPRAPRWTRQQIRAARMAPLAPLLQKRALQLIELPAGNFELAAYKGLLLKDSYWRGPSETWPATPSTFSSKSWAYPLTTPCAKSSAPSISHGRWHRSRTTQERRFRPLP